MEPRRAARLGFTIAGLALAAALAGWPRVAPITAGLAAVSGIAFGGRRYGRLGRERGAPLAGVTSLALAAAGASAAVGPAAGSVTSAGIGAAGFLAATLAYADWKAIPSDRMGRMLVAAVNASAVGVAGLLAIVVWGRVLVAVVRVLAPGWVTPSLAIPLSTVALGLGTSTIAAGYLAASARGPGFIDLGRPGVTDTVYVVGGVIALVGLNVGIGLAFRRLGVESAQHAIVRQAASDPGILLVLVPLSYLVIAPGEELLYRNVVQKSLYDAFSRRGAIAVASAIFAAVHLFAFADPDGSTLATVNTLSVVFVLSLVLGAVYARTQNLVVPVLVHGSFDAIAFAATYVRIAGP